MQLDDTLLIQYALGMLGRAKSVLVDEALSASAELRKQLYEIQETLRLMALAEPPLQPDHRLKERILISIDRTRRFEGFTRRFAELFDLGEQEARRLLAKIDQAEASEWTASLLPGVSILKFSGGLRVSAATCGLVTVKPDTIFPRHRHQGEERVLCLQGRAREHTGRILHPGDLLCSAAGSDHAFVTLGRVPFVFAVLLSKDNKWLIFQSLLDRVLEKYRFARGSDE